MSISGQIGSNSPFFLPLWNYMEEFFYLLFFIDGIDYRWNFSVNLMGNSQSWKNIFCQDVHICNFSSRTALGITLFVCLTHCFSKFRSYFLNSSFRRKNRIWSPKKALFQACYLYRENVILQGKRWIFLYCLLFCHIL